MTLPRRLAAEFFAGMFDQNADQWARQEPMILSDFTAGPLVLRELAPVTGKHVLDLGCGEGYVARLVAQAGAQSVFGIDISSEMVARAQQAAASGARCPMSFKSGNATNFREFPREQFDRVMGNRGASGSRPGVFRRCRGLSTAGSVSH